jgi:hypothetical protein
MDMRNWGHDVEREWEWECDGGGGVGRSREAAMEGV